MPRRLPNLYRITPFALLYLASIILGSALLGVMARQRLVAFSFAPALLLLPIVLIYSWWVHVHTVTDMSPARKRIAFTFRSILLALLVFTMAGTSRVRRGDSLAVVFLVDGSRSIRDNQRAAIRKYLADAAKGMRPVDKVGVITFGQDPHTQSSPGQPFDPSRIRDPGLTSATDIEQALRFARNELESSARDSGKRIVLLSDGNENIGHALGEARDLAASHVLLDTVALPVALEKEALIDKMVLPARVKIGEPFPVRIVISSLTAQTATVALTRDGKTAGASKRVDLHIGKNVVVFDQNIEHPGFFRYGATLDAPDDTIAENNRGEGFVLVKGKPTVLYVADSSDLTGFLQHALRSENIDVQYANPAALPSNAADLQRYDSVFLSNVLASDLSQNQMLALQVSCRDFGIGFGMVGGVNSFGSGYYRGTPIEDTLPVSMDVKKQKRLPSVAVVLVIEDLEIPTSINMSIEAAKATIDNLEPIDQVGVLDCNGYGGFGFGGGASSPSGTWRIQMTHVTDRDGIKAQIQRLQEMGDPPSYTPFLVEAARVLNQTDAKVKHIVFLGDGDAINEASQGETSGALKKIRDMGITVSTIASGATEKSDVQFMAAIALAGGGQAYVADQPQDLPRLLLKDAQTISQPPIIEEPFHPVPVDTDEVFKGIDWSSAPALLGYNISNLKETASLSLISHRKDPIFAGWRYGLGRSVAFMSDDRAHWAAPWMGWEGYSKFWAQAVRWTLRPFAPSDYSTQVVMDGNRGHIIVDALDDKGKYVNRLQFDAHVAPPSDGSPHAPPSIDERLHQTGPGHYEGWFDAPHVGTYLVNVVDQEAGAPRASSTVVGLSTAYSPEYRETQPNRYLMTQLADAGGGRADPSPQVVFTADRPDIFALRDAVPMLLLLAMALLPIDIAVRRLAFDRDDARRAIAWLRGKAPHLQSERAATPELGRLLDRKQTAQSSYDLDVQGAAIVGVGAASGRESEVPAFASPNYVEPPAAFLPVSSSSAANTPVGAVAPTSQRSQVDRTIRPDMPANPEPANSNRSEPAATSPAAQEAPGMSRLMAAKRRAQQMQEKEIEPAQGAEPKPNIEP